VRDLQQAVPSAAVVSSPAEGPSPTGSRGWLPAAGVVVLLIAVFVFGRWCYARQRRHAGKGSPPTPVPAGGTGPYPGEDRPA
jgi:hypothetical protein